jgi:uncharacterized protein YhaN
MMRAIQMRAGARHQQVGRHLEQEIADEEDAGADAIHGIAELQVGLHLQLGEADIDAVQIGRDKAQEQERHEAPADPAVQLIKIVIHEFSKLFSKTLAEVNPPPIEYGLVQQL